MPATFAHCLIGTKAIDVLLKKKKKILAKILSEHNSFVITGATGPDYPYLTDVLTTGVLKIGHTWANRMHYESVTSFAKEGVTRLASMDKKSEPFAIRLAWFWGRASKRLDCCRKPDAVWRQSQSRQRDGEGIAAGKQSDTRD